MNGNERRAVIDVGTNSVKLLVAELSSSPDAPNARLIPILEKSDQTRLGKGFYSTHQLQPAAIERTVQAVAHFAREAQALGSQHIRVIGTSAAREAINQADLVNAIRHTANLALEIISGEQEAEWVFAGVSTDPQFGQRSIVIVDVGGGSTEFIVGHNGQAQFRCSFPLGTVRLFEQFQFANPPSLSEFQICKQAVDDFLSREVSPQLRPALRALPANSPQLVGTGGTTTILAGMHLKLTAFDRQRIESVCLSQADVIQWESRLWSMPLESRKTIPGLPPNRADVILFGAAIFSGIMRHFNFPNLRPTTRGLRFAAVLATPGAQASGRW